jgi:N-methylhydantoinase A
MAELARALGGTPDDAAEGVLAVADAAMERALRVISVERGHDPAGFALVAFGGAGALHAAGLAQRLGCSRALVPPEPGLLSAYGILTAPVTREASRTLLLSSKHPDTRARVASELATLGRSAAEALEREGVAADTISLSLKVDARYRGQSFELRVGADPGADDWVEALHTAHARRYGYRRDDAEVEAVTVRATATAPGPPVEHPRLDPAEAAPSIRPLPVTYRGRILDASAVWRRDLRPGHNLSGPALVLDYSATTWIPPEWILEVDAWGVLHLVPGAETRDPGTPA